MATQKVLAEAAEKSDAIMVAFSGGKDSLIVLELCMRTFKRVEGFHMFLVPGLQCVEEKLEPARQKYGLKITQYPHWIVRKLLVEGIFCNNHYTFDDLPDYTLRNVYDLAKLDSGIPLIAHGGKRADSMWRRRNLYLTRSWTDIIYPILEWSVHDVRSYLSTMKIALPDAESTVSSGVDLSTSSMLWMHDRYPEDFKKVCEVFPYAEALVWRRKFHGVGKFYAQS